jgi:hypothetical protein
MYVAERECSQIFKSISPGTCRVARIRVRIETFFKLGLIPRCMYRKSNVQCFSGSSRIEFQGRMQSFAAIKCCDTKSMGL